VDAEGLQDTQGSSGAPMVAVPLLRERARRVATSLAGRPIVLVGMMGSGKSSVGKRLAQKLELPFADADAEIETAAGMSIPDMFQSHGEAFFRDGERRVIHRLLAGGCRVIATGGGAYMNAETRHRIAETAISVWLDARVEVLMRRVRRRGNRPLLQTDDPEATMRALMVARDPFYAEADLRVISDEGPHDATVAAVIAALEAHLASEQPAP